MPDEITAGAKVEHEPPVPLGEEVAQRLGQGGPRSGVFAAGVFSFEGHGGLAGARKGDARACCGHGTLTHWEHP